MAATRLGGVDQRLLVVLAGGGAAMLGVLAGAAPTVAILGSLAAVFVLIAFGNLAAGVAAFAFLASFELSSLGPVSLVKGTGALLALAWIATLAGHRMQGVRVRRQLLSSPFLALLLAFIGWTFLSIVWAVGAEEARGAAIRLLINLALFPIMVTAFTSSRSLSWVFWASLLGAVATVIYGFAQPQAFAIEGRLSGAGTESNELAVILIIGLVFAVALAADRETVPGLRALAATGALLCAIGTVLTYSRGGLLPLGMVLIVGLVLAVNRRGSVLVLALTAVIAVTSYLAVWAPPEARERLTDVDTGSGRTDLWSTAQAMIADRPVIGVGISNFQVVSRSYIEVNPGVDIGELKTPEGTPKVAHSIYLETLAELGIIGFALFAGVVATCVASAALASRRFRRSGQERSALFARAVVIAQAGTLAAGAFVSIQFEDQFWLILAMGPAVWALAQRGPSAGAAAARSPARAG